MALANEIIAKVQALNCRSRDAIAPKVRYVVEMAYEPAGDLAGARPHVNPTVCNSFDGYVTTPHCSEVPFSPPR